MLQRENVAVTHIYQPAVVRANLAQRLGVVKTTPVHYSVSVVLLAVDGSTILFTTSRNTVPALCYWQRQTSGRYILVPLPGSVYSFAVMYEVGGGGDVVALRLITYRCVS